MTKKVKTNSVSDIIKETRIIGDISATDYHNSKNIKSGYLALSAWRTSISANKLLLQHKKMTGDSTVKRIK